MYKLIIAIVGVAIVSVGVVHEESIADFFDNTVTVQNLKPETIIQKERVNELDVRLAEAEAEARGGIEAEALAKYEVAVAAAEDQRQKSVAKELKKVEDKVKGDYIAEIEATIESPSY
jgi:hypothetical protein